MNEIWTVVISTAVTVFVSLLVTFIFNKVSGIPTEMKKQKKAQQDKIDTIECNLNAIEVRLAKVEESVGHYPEYRAQSLKIQGQLKEADNAIVELCKEIKDDVVSNRQLLNNSMSELANSIDERLSSLESREKNSLRAKILNEYRLYTDEHKNPMLAWTEMEHHSFFKLVEDYESLGGNDYVHKTILPAMNELDVIPMDDLSKIKDLYDSRNVK